MNRKLSILFIFLVAPYLLMAQDSPDTSDYYEPGQLVMFNDITYEKNIKTVRLHPYSWELSPPVIELNSDQKLKLSFDDFSGEIQQYNYTIIHCDHEWQPTNVSSSEYIDGYSEDVISDYKYSFNTLQSFIHYSLTFPTEVMKIKHSGNYLINVYHAYDPDKLVLTRRFMVTENSAEVIGNAHRATLARYSSNMQEIDFTVTNGNISGNEAYTNTKIVLMQNNRWDNAVYGLKPLFMNDNTLTYEYEERNLFYGGNEYRHFDLRTLRMQTDRVSRIMNDSTLYHVYLTMDEKRSFKRYFSESDINGSYIIKTQEGRDNETDADYVKVHFALKSPEPISEGNVYIFGQLTDWQCKPEYRMRYNREKGYYTATAILKQGYYNYEYAVLKDAEFTADNTIVEGSHYETENNYSILVYLYDIRLNMDRLIAIRNLNTINKE